MMEHLHDLLACSVGAAQPQSALEKAHARHEAHVVQTDGAQWGNNAAGGRSLFVHYSNCCAHNLSSLTSHPTNKHDHDWR